VESGKSKVKKGWLSISGSRIGVKGTARRLRQKSIWRIKNAALEHPEQRLSLANDSVT
jgi:hypothetical protein